MRRSSKISEMSYFLLYEDLITNQNNEAIRRPSFLFLLGAPSMFRVILAAQILISKPAPVGGPWV